MLTLNRLLQQQSVQGLHCLCRHICFDVHGHCKLPVLFIACILFPPLAYYNRRTVRTVWGNTIIFMGNMKATSVGVICECIHDFLVC